MTHLVLNINLDSCAVNLIWVCLFHFVSFGQLIHLQLCWFNSLIQGSWILIILKNHSNIAHFRANCRPQEKCQNIPWRTKKCKKKTDLRLFFDFLQKKISSYLEVGRSTEVGWIVHLRFFSRFRLSDFSFPKSPSEWPRSF